MDGGGDWPGRPIGATFNETHQNYSRGDFRVQDKVGWEGGYDIKDGGGSGSVMCIVPLSKMEFLPYDGTTNAVEWLQKCHYYFADQKVFNDDAKVRQTIFVLT